MAKRKVVIDIQLDGTNSILDLENQLRDINSELKNVDINSNAFDELSKKAVRVKGELNNIKNGLKPITDRQQLTAIKKIGDGISGAFQIGGAAAALFGEQTQEEFQKIAKTVGGVVVAIDGFKKLMELTSKENIARLKSIGESWGIVGKQAKVAGVSMRSAIMGTGIGILLIAIAALIANFDKLKSVGSKRNEKQLKELELELEKERELLDVQLKKLELQQKLNDMRGVDKNLEEVVDIANTKIKTINSEITSLVMELHLVEEKIINLEKGYDVFKNKKSKSGQIEKENVEDLLKIERDRKKILDERIQLLQVEGEIIKEEYKDKEIELEFLNVIDNEIEKREKELEIIKNIKFNSNEIFLLEDQILELEIMRLKYSEKNEVKREKEIKYLEKEREFLQLNNKLLNVNLNVEKNLIDLQIKYLEYQNQLNMKLAENNVERQKGINDFNKNLLLNDLYMNQIEYERYLFEKISEINSKRIEFDKRGNSLINERLESLKLTADYEEMIDINIERMNVNLDDFTNKQQNIIRNSAFQLGLNEKELNVIDSSFKIKFNQFTDEIKFNENLIDLYKETDSFIVEKIKLNEKLLKSYEDDLKGTNNLEKQIAILEQIESIRTNLNSLNIEKLNNLNEIQIIENKILGIENEKQILNEETLTRKNEIIQENDEIYYQLNEELRLINQIKEFIGKFNEEIEVSQDILYESINLISILYARQAEMRKRELEDWKEANKQALDEIGEAEKKLNSRRNELNRLLADAEGERYAEILRELEAINDAEEQNAANKEAMQKKEAEMQYEIDLANWRSHVASKTEAMIDSTINTALAIVKALPNVVLANLVGILGGVQTGIIAAQPVPQKPSPPKFALGGEVYGHSHTNGGVTLEAEGGEFIVNKAAYRMYGDLIKSLNNSVVPKYANGGEVGQNTINTPATTQLINYDEISKSMVLAMKNNPIFVSVKEFRDVESRMKVVERRSSF